jgi:transposase-like protein
MLEQVVIVLGVIVVPAAATLGMLALGTRKFPCPACGKRAMQVVGVRRIDSAIERMYRCGACKEDFMRLGKGPLVPKREWDAAGPSARSALPPARLIDR